jgi:hypothetical protein
MYLLKYFRCIFLVLVSCVVYAVAVNGQDSGQNLYYQIKLFQLNGGIAEVSNLILKKDRVEMTFNGTFYFQSPISGQTTGAVFIGNGTMKSDVPPSYFEKDNVKRLLGTELIESNFKTAVLRFTDDTMSVIGAARKDGNSTQDAQKTATEFSAKFLKETGANIAARLATSILNKENPGFFSATFDGGKLDRFTFLLDYQCRIPTDSFSVNGGEKGLIFSYKNSLFANDIWMAFYSAKEYEEKSVAYSDVNDIVDITHYDLNLDLTNPNKNLGLKAIISMKTLSSNVVSIPFRIGESLGERDNVRLKNQMRIKQVRLNSENLSFFQEDWEGGFTVVLPKRVEKNTDIKLEIELSGDFMRSPYVRDETGGGVENLYYPTSNESWYPRHGYLDRATYDFTFLHKKNLKIASVGTRLSEERSTENNDFFVTKYVMKYPVSLATFALAPFERHVQQIKWDKGDKPINLEFSSLPGDFLRIKEDFILAELDNSVRFFHALFGQYPYDTFSAAYHPYGFGQGFPSLLMIPRSDTSSKFTFAFLSHEVAHQWWGNIVAWRSYRDQWLSEGFAEYSGLLYTAFRENPKAATELLHRYRDSLSKPPSTTTGIGKGKLADIGPLILGHRLDSSKSLGTYSTLIYSKGALVLRMFHFLLSDPVTGDDKPFFAMMNDFVEKYRNSVASTDDFRKVANTHFINSPIAKKYGLKNLDLFFNEWVYRTDFPSYQINYSVQPQPDGKFNVVGNVLQSNVHDDFFMPLPITFIFNDGKSASGTIPALGQNTPFKITLPINPVKVEIDKGEWILAEKIEVKKQ